METRQTQTSCSSVLKRLTILVLSFRFYFLEGLKRIFHNRFTRHCFFLFFDFYLFSFNWFVKFLLFFRFFFLLFFFYFCFVFLLFLDFPGWELIEVHLQLWDVVLLEFFDKITCRLVD